MTKTKLPTAFKKRLKKCFACGKKGIASVYDHKLKNYKTTCKYCGIVHLSKKLELVPYFRTANQLR